MTIFNSGLISSKTSIKWSKPSLFNYPSSQRLRAWRTIRASFLLKERIAADGYVLIYSILPDFTPTTELWSLKKGMQNGSISFDFTNRSSIAKSSPTAYYSEQIFIKVALSSFMLSDVDVKEVSWLSNYASKSSTPRLYSLSLSKTRSIVERWS